LYDIQLSQTPFEQHTAVIVFQKVNILKNQQSIASTECPSDGEVPELPNNFYIPGQVWN
jgi:hypothetical protein